MTDDRDVNNLCELVSLGSLGALDARELWRLREHLLDCASCRAELEADERVVAQLGYAAEPVAPSPMLKFRLFDQIQGRSKPIDALPTLEEAIDWKPYPIPGVRYRALNVDTVKREVLMIVRAEPGVTYPTHRHSALEEMFMLEGELDFGGTVYGPGDYIRAECGSTHEESETRTGCMFLIRASLDDQMHAVN